MPSYTNSRTSRPKSYSVYSSSNHRSRRGNKRSSGKKHGEYIDPSRFIKTAEQQVVVDYTAKHAFSDFNIAEALQTNLAAKGYTIPSPIQDQTIPLGLDGKDVIGLANTGTGKTAAFLIPLLNKLLSNPQARALIVAPTRELAMQIEDERRSLSRGGQNLRGALLIGGSSMSFQLRDLKNRPRIVVGTPGRIKDHIERGTFKPEFFNTVVLDEVDRMLDMGFVNDVTEILSHLGQPRQSFFFSATMDARVQGLIRTFSTDPVTVSVVSGDTSASVNQDVIRFQASSEKMNLLHDILIRPDVTKTIVFDETQRSVEKLGNELQARGFKVEAIHGGKSQGQRKRALANFKASQADILVATDVAARGIDVADISHVINFSEPQTYQDYVHRIGRAGRAGKIGHALTFVSK